jgi:hypothetical protein
VTWRGAPSGALPYLIVTKARCDMRDNTYFNNMHTFTLEILLSDRLAGVVSVACVLVVP